MQAQAQPTLRRQPGWVEDPNILGTKYAGNISTTLIDTQIISRYVVEI